MGHNRSITAVLIAAAAIAGALGLSTASAGEGQCSWGGSPTARTGTFTITPGARLAPSEEPLHLWATGELAGDDPRCVGTLTIEGTLAEGSGCLSFTEEAEATFHDALGNIVDHGVERIVGAGGAYSRAVMLGPDGEVVATYDAFARSPDAVPFTEACNSEAGLSQGTFSSVAGLRFAD